MSSKRSNIPRPHSFSGELDDADDHKKTKKKWQLKLFKTQEEDESQKLTDSPEQTKTMKKKFSKSNSDEITQLQDKVTSLERQLENIKQHRIMSLAKPGTEHRHQRRDLTEANWGTFQFRGTVFVSTRVCDEHIAFEVEPDACEMVRGERGHSCLRQTVRGIDFALDFEATPSAAPRVISLFYFLRGAHELRFDHLFNIAIPYKSLMEDLAEFRDKRDRSDNIFEFTDFYHGFEIKSRIEISESRPPVLTEFHITIPLDQDKRVYKSVSDPIFTSKTIQNFWFKMEISRKGQDKELYGPFCPHEQQLNMEDTHYFLEQDIALPGFVVLGAPKGVEKKIEKTSSFEHIFIFTYSALDRSEEESSMYCLCAIEISLAEIVKCSEGNQKRGDRFHLEKQLDLGAVRATFHFYVAEELIPEPSMTGQALNPLFGYWILERVSLALRV